MNLRFIEGPGHRFTVNDECQSKIKHMSETKVETSSVAIVASGHQFESEYRKRVIDFNLSSVPYPAAKTVIHLFEGQVERTPEVEAIHLDNQCLTYRELNERSNQMAASLRAIGVGTGQLIALYMNHSIEVVCTILGILKAGAAYVPIDIATPAGRLGYILQDIGKGDDGRLPVLITQPDLTKNLPVDMARVLIVEPDFVSLQGYPDVNPTVAATPGDIAYVIYTSGSTGTPKGVMVEHRGLTNYICWAASTYCGGQPLTWPLFSSLAFDLTVTSIFTPLISGGRIRVFREGSDTQAKLIFKVIEDNSVDIVKLTPAHLAMIKDMISGNTSIRKFIVGGEDFKTQLALEITSKAGGPVHIYNEYGPTEATVGCMIHRFDMSKDTAASVPIGIPAANTCIFILDEHLKPVPVGKIGEMYIGGEGLARGYFKQPELTNAKFLMATDPRQALSAGEASSAMPELLRLYRTGDLARWGGNSQIEFLGRADFQVKIGGARIELGEIEAHMLRHADIRESVVNVVDLNSDESTEAQQPTSGEPSIACLVAYYVSDKSLDPVALRNQLASELPHYMLPSHFVRLDAFPLTTNGKIDRKSLPSPMSDNLAILRSFVKPQTDVEKSLAVIWADLLKIKSVGIHDDFFDLGGNSLLAIRAVTRIRQVFDVDLSLRVLFEHSTIAGLAGAIDALAWLAGSDKSTDAAGNRDEIEL